MATCVGRFDKRLSKKQLTLSTFAGKAGRSSNWSCAIVAWQANATAYCRHVPCQSDLVQMLLRLTEHIVELLAKMQAMYETLCSKQATVAVDPAQADRPGSFLVSRLVSRSQSHAH